MIVEIIAAFITVIIIIALYATVEAIKDRKRRNASQAALVAIFGPYTKSLELLDKTYLYDSQTHRILLDKNKIYDTRAFSGIITNVHEPPVRSGKRCCYSIRIIDDSKRTIALLRTGCPSTHDTVKAFLESIIEEERAQSLR